MVINARLREFLHQRGVLGRFIEKVEQIDSYPEVVETISEAISMNDTIDEWWFWRSLNVEYAAYCARYEMKEPKAYTGDDDSRAE